METFHVDGGDGFDEPFAADEAGSSSYSKLISMSSMRECVIGWVIVTICHTQTHMHKYVYTASQLSIGSYIFSWPITSLDPSMRQ